MDLTASVESVKGVGEKTAAVLKKAGIFSVRDLLYCLPRTYENYQTSTKIRDLKPGKVIVKGKISDLKTQRTRRRNFNITTGVIRDDTGALRVTWFNQPYRVKQFDPEKEYYFTGNYDLKAGRYQLSSASAVLANEVEKAEQSSSYVPIYPAKGGIKSREFQKFLGNLRGEFWKIPDLIPGAKSGLRADSLFAMHFPENEKEVATGRQYLAYEELYGLLLAAQLSKAQNQKLVSEKIPFVAENTKSLTESLPFQLTNAQRLATWDILQDLEKDTPMNRLLQGDVGSGKTIVAGISAFQAIKSGFQVALLAPTAILAAQHAESLNAILGPLGVKIALLTGATKHKDLLKKQLRDGEIDLLIGTHAIITDDTQFNNLAFCIIDEQHRFGVNQRQKLLLKTAHNASGNNKAPHLLAMTATPIPRSLQLTVFGDLDVSIIGELPKGRQPIQTQILKEIQMKDDLYPKIREELAAKHQVYWICKAIEDVPNSEVKSVKDQTKKLQTIFKDAKVEFLHGKMKPAEKDEIMERFASGEIEILVSTTVVEVGVNVPNASLMVIMDAEGYGLAQLHQLRGRVGRGSTASFCYLITTDNENPPSRRLRELEKSTDGFYLAEVDLKIRGPGEIYGALQHGALDLRIASLTDTKLIARASANVKKFVAAVSENPELMLKYKELGASVSYYQQLTTLN